jgi:hypothetical protein
VALTAPAAAATTTPLPLPHPTGREFFTCFTSFACWFPNTAAVRTPAAAYPTCCRFVTRATKPDLMACTVLLAPHCWQRRCMRRVALSLSSRVSTLLQPGHSTYLQPHTLKHNMGKAVSACEKEQRISRKACRDALPLHARLCTHARHAELNV